MAKGQKVIVNDKAKLEAVISDLDAIANEINCMFRCGDDDPDRFCFKKCTSKVRIHKDNARTEQKAIT
jgi:hypothetical protein